MGWTTKQVEQIARRYVTSEKRLPRDAGAATEEQTRDVICKRLKPV
jgi:hypothetical protein